VSKQFRFTFVCDGQERSVLTALASRMHRSRSDAVRLLIMEAARGLKDDKLLTLPGFIPEAQATMPIRTESVLETNDQDISTAVRSLPTQAAGEITGATLEGVTAQ